MANRTCLLIGVMFAALMVGCGPSVQLPSVQEPLDSSAWERCSGELDELQDPNAPRMAEELTTSTKTMICRGVVAAAKGNEEKGLEILNEAAIKDKKDHRPLYLAGRILAEQGRYEEALTAFERSAKRFPSIEVPTERIGRKIEGKESPAAALAFLLMARDRQLCPYGCMGFVAKLYQRSGEYEKAEATYVEMIHETPGEPAAYVGIAGIRNHAGNYGEEVKMLEQAEKARHFQALSDGQKADIYFSLAFASYNAEEFGSAQVAIERALALKKDRPEWLVLAGWIEMKQGRPEAAERWFAKARLADSGFAAAHEGIGDAKIEMGKVHEAIGAYRRAADIDPTSVVYMLKLAYAHALIGDRDTAARLVADATHLDRDHLPEELLSKVAQLLEQNTHTE
ncbi:MAG: tetratricopeptide repeat protein [Proteobacteria bacterium]|nr:tetratricopeptide repeat protein [Pseudomonadota bacterium]